VPEITKTRADKAGDRLRKMELAAADVALDGYDREAEMDCLRAWRRAHWAPMRSTGTFVRSAYASVVGGSPNRRVLSRLKREDQILAKLYRQRTRLSTVEDIAGCRAVVPDLATVYRLSDHISSGARRMEVVDQDDYIRDLTPTGYRALHLHCLRDERKVEVQIRTAWQHTWAEVVEGLDRRYGMDAKHGDAPEPVMDGLRSLSDALAVRDTDGRTIYAELKLEGAINALSEAMAEVVGHR
jgi:ppGpp synthetase/RelA/SpoT-type nucleotidyltranferase